MRFFNAALLIGLVLASDCCGTEPSSLTATSQDIGIWRVPKEQVDAAQKKAGAQGRNVVVAGPNPFLFDGDTVTLRLHANEQDWMWSPEDNTYRVKSKWVGNVLHILYPFGGWDKFTTFASGRFQIDWNDVTWTYERIGSGELEERDLRLILKRDVHDESRHPWAPVDPTSEIDFDDSDDLDDPTRVTVLSDSETLLQRRLRSLGLFYGLTILALGFIMFFGSWWVVVTQRCPAVVAAYCVLLFIPLLLGVLGSVQRFIELNQSMAWTELPFKHNTIAAETMAALAPILAAVIVTLPSLCVLSVGLFLKTLKAPTSTTDDHESKVESQPSA